jgi:hypothetical protein
MSSPVQPTGSCGHKKAFWDSHSKCLACCGCSVEQPCNTSGNWDDATWKLASARRTYASRKVRASEQLRSSQSPDSVTGSGDNEISTTLTTSGKGATISKRYSSPSPGRSGRRPGSRTGRLRVKSSSSSSSEELDYDNTDLEPLDSVVTSVTRSEVKRAFRPRNSAPGRFPVTRDSRDSGVSDTPRYSKTTGSDHQMVSHTDRPPATEWHGSPTTVHRTLAGTVHRAVKPNCRVLPPSGNDRPPGTGPDHSPDIGHRPPGTGHRSPTTVHRTQVTDHRPPPTVHRPPTGGDRPPGTVPDRIPGTGHRAPSTVHRLRCTVHN